MEFTRSQIEELPGHSRLIYDIFDSPEFALKFQLSNNDSKSKNLILDYVVLNTLSDEEIIVLRYSYGVMGHEIGDRSELEAMQYLLTREGIEVLREKSLKKLRAYTPASVIRSLINL